MQEFKEDIYNRRDLYMEENQVHKRRVRYKGTHPRKFEEKYKEKYTKALYDQAALIRSMLADGADIDMINKVLRNTEEE